MPRNEIFTFPDAEDDALLPVPGAATFASGSAEDDSVEDLAPDARCRPINYRFLLAFAAIVGLVTYGASALHDYQMRRMAGALLARAEQARAEGNLPDAVMNLRRYLNLVPDDDDAKTDLALALDELAETPRQHYQAFVVYEELLRRDKDRSGIRRNLIDILMDFGRYGDAIFHLRFLLHSAPNDPELLSLLAECYDGSRKNSEAVAAYEAAIKAAPRRTDNYAALARILNDRLKRPEDAENVLDRLVAANPASHESYLARAEFRVERGNLKAAVLDARRALQLAPQAHNVLLLAATILSAGAESGVDEDFFNVPEIRTRLETALQSVPAKETPSGGGTPIRTRLIEAVVQLDRLLGRTDEAERRLRAELEAEPDNMALAWLLADILSSQEKVDAARAEVERLRQQKADPTLIAYLEGRIAMIEQDWVTAIDKLEDLRSAWIQRADVQAHLNLHLGECYRQLGHTERELAAFQRAAEANAYSPRAHIGVASAAARLGRLDVALFHYGQAADQPRVRGRIARLTLQQTMKMPPEERDWQKVENAIDAAAREPTSVTEALLLRAGLLIYRDQREQARGLLERAVQRRPQDAELWVALAELYDQNGNTEAAYKTLQQAEEKLGRRISLALGWIQHWAKRGGDEAIAALERLQKEQARFDEVQRLQLLQGLAAAYEFLGDNGQAEQLWLEVAERSPNHLIAWRRLLEFAFREGSAEKIRTRLAEIRHIEGENGIHWRLGEARAAMLRARAGDGKALEEAEQFLEQVASQIPNSPRVALAFGELYEAQGKDDLAITRYLEVLEREGRNPQTVSRVVRLLYRRRRYYEAEQVIRNFQKGAPAELTEDIGRLAAAVSLRTKDYDRALEFARQAVADRASDYRDHIWLGQVLQAAKRPAEAEKSFRNAVEKGRERPEPWVALVSFLAAMGRGDEARRVIEKSEASITPELRVLTLAQCYELIGDQDQAGAHYQRALETEGRDPNVVWTVAGFEIRRGNLPAAERLLRTLLEPEYRAHDILQAAARRELAKVLAAQGTRQAIRDGLALVEKNFSDGQRRPEDVRVKARLLAAQPLKNAQRDAITLLESLEERVALTADDQFQLARLYLALGDWPKANQRLLMLITGHEPTPDQLAFGIRAMLDHAETRGSITEWLDRLRNEQPRAFRTQELEARYLASENRVDEAIAVLTAGLALDQLDSEDNLERATAVAAVLADLSRRLERIGRTLAADQLAGEAERIYRVCAERNAPSRILLAQFLGRQWRVDEALAICKNAWDVLPANAVAVACVDILRSGHGNRTQAEQVAQWLDSALKRQPDSAELSFQRANVAQIAGDYAAATRYYRKTIEMAPQSPIAYNELALLLALQGEDAAAALGLINQAIDLAGPLAFLLDTRATVYLALDRPDAAIADLELAIADMPSAAKHFHLAQALTAAGKRTAAQHALRTAISEGLHSDSVHPLEKSAYQQLTQQLQRP